MINTHKSDSSEQIQAEEHIFSLVEQKLGITLEKNKKLYLADNVFTYIQPDFFSKDAYILGEIFSHIGKPKKAQNNKIANDILKMLAYEKVTGTQFRKIIVVCDQDEYDNLQGLSVLAETIRQFEIDLLYVQIDEGLQHKLLAAQKRQRMINE